MLCICNFVVVVGVAMLLRPEQDGSERENNATRSCIEPLSHVYHDGDEVHSLLDAENLGSKKLAPCVRDGTSFAATLFASSLSLVSANREKQVRRKIGRRANSCMPQPQIESSQDQFDNAIRKQYIRIVSFVYDCIVSPEIR